MTVRLTWVQVHHCHSSTKPATRSEFGDASAPALAVVVVVALQYLQFWVLCFCKKERKSKHCSRILGGVGGRGVLLLLLVHTVEVMPYAA